MRPKTGCQNDGILSISIHAPRVRCDQQLEMLQIQLDETQQSLMNAKISMTEAQHELSELKVLLEGLKNKIKKLEHKQAVIRRQRDIYAGLLVITVGTVIARG